MSKRGADKQLTHDNWDAEDSGGEDAGQFQAASEEVLRGRVIKKARRRVNRSDDSSGAAPSPFAAFSGFKAPTAKPAGGADNPFGFLAAAAKSSPTAAKSSPAAEKTGSEASKAFSPAALPSTPAAKVSSSDLSTPTTMSSPVLTRPPLRSGTSGGSGSSEYHRQLQALNRSMLSWLQTHVDKNPLCILTPVFKDYETHLASIERRFGPVTTPTTGGAASSAVTEKTTSVSASTGGGFSFGSGTTKPADAASPPKSTGFSFGTGAGKAADTGGTGGSSAGGFSFGLPQGKAGLAGAGGAPAASAGFSFGLSSSGKKADASPAAAAPASTAGFSFGFQSGSQGGGAAPATSSEEAEESEEPPVPVVNTVKEDDAIYSKKCKLFYKKDGSFVEKGVGMLYLKPCSDDKYQCLIRADTNLGNILLNIKLSNSIPTQRMGKNNVMMACVPNPPLDPKKKEAESSPVPLLIRVKTGDDADELLRQIDEHKR
ncbi:nuclear pore complex protein Nup50-like [Amphibalanus amphitrite]|uniref:nuclear pore complex protein Nup50-like n=1 Tax=Amphibalanus amphitrite TaxID=1232801 RepID=UPI001C91F226|nr:nuclear pore complex protein Nup50-like [Amphibalanus amphitrite]XP_043224071.1 nuclear pore complex protein Nup50-like [Amphibalanus amphitrite]XP_043224072.1 nuclear pore complex protein Nup50-like [Amphibalanus amphitrite]XP_043224073.1 nuclear pore complex protein Nup50-like [Amphibalanus amphitrite]XP_043224074.1 nuclear pore complex protein Nup50-like [Amphibalanus amphitrite]